MSIHRYCIPVTNTSFILSLMPASRTARAQRQTIYSRRMPLGPLSQQDPDLANMSKVQARRMNSDRLFAAAFRVAGERPVLARICNIPGHQPSKPLLCIGQKIMADFGRWYQVVSSERHERSSLLTGDYNSVERALPANFVSSRNACPLITASAPKYNAFRLSPKS